VAVARGQCPTLGLVKSSLKSVPLFNLEKYHYNIMNPIYLPPH